jgi:hypothetical protein
VARRTWILQSNADRIDHAVYLRAGETTVHGVRRYPDRSAPGDVVWLWRAKGRTRTASGIVARGTVEESATVRGFDRTDAARGETVLRPKLRVVVRVQEVRLSPEEGMITRDDVRRVPEMASHPIVTSNTGSDFALDDAQAAALNALWATEASGPVI